MKLIFKLMQGFCALKLRLVVYTTLLYIPFLSSNSQPSNLWPTGTTWHYTFRYEESFYIDYVKYEVTKDTVVQDSLCRIISAAHYTPDGVENMGKEIIYTANDKVFVLINGAFHLLFDFSAKPGDTITVIEEPFQGFFDYKYDKHNKFEYYILSKDIYVQSKDTIITIETVATENSDWILGANKNNPSVLLDKIGIKNPWQGNIFGTSLFIVPYNFISSIRCFNDTQHSYEFSDYACDEIVTSITSPEEDVFDVLYPNPGNGVFHINAGGSENISGIRIYNLFGRLILDQETKCIVDISSHPKGLYIYEIEFLDGKLRRGRVLSY